jgi:hypothetical protein
MHHGQFYNSKKKELMATDGQFQCDGRLNMRSTIMEARRQARMFDKNFPHKDITYVRLYRGRASEPRFYTELINLRE